MSQPITILILYHEPGECERLVELLHKEDCIVIFADTCAEALAFAESLRLDMILLNRQDVDGFEICRCLRATPAGADVPILMQAALDDAQARRQGIAAGVDDFVASPLDDMELPMRMRIITRPRRGVPTPGLAADSPRRQHQNGSMAMLRAIDSAIVSSLDLGMTLNIILDQIMATPQIGCATVLVRKPESQLLEYAAIRGEPRSAFPRESVHFGVGCAGYVALHRRPLRLPDRPQAGAPRAHALQSQGYAAYYGLPLVVKGRVEGVLEIFQRTPIAWDAEWLEGLEMIAIQAAIAIDHAILSNGMQQANIELLLTYDFTLEGWARVLELRDKETEGHSQRVTELTLKLAYALGLDDAEMVHIRRGALLHDIGKIGIPDSILLKPGPLNDQEYEVMRQHPTYAYDLLAPIAFLRPALDIPYCHHERWDGNGYPRGLQGEEIPLAARIFSVVDVWDALRYDRPYRKGWTEAQVREYIQSQAGRLFDPRIVEVFLRLLAAEQAAAVSSVLVVDDQAEVVEVMSRALGDLFTVFTAHTGEVALQIIEREEIAIILTDQRMPDLTGVQLLERAKHIRPTALGLLCSAHFDREALVDAQNLGTVRGFIHKPWRVTELRQRVSDVARQQRLAFADSECEETWSTR